MGLDRPGLVVADPEFSDDLTQELLWRRVALGFISENRGYVGSQPSLECQNQVGHQRDRQHQSRSASAERQFVADGLFAVANQEPRASQGWVVPRLAVRRRDPPQLAESLRSRFDQHDVS